MASPNITCGIRRCIASGMRPITGRRCVAHLSDLRYAHPISDAIEGITQSLCRWSSRITAAVDWVVEISVTTQRFARAAADRVRAAQLNTGDEQAKGDGARRAEARRRVGTTRGCPRWRVCDGGLHAGAIRAFCSRVGGGEESQRHRRRLLEHTVREDLNRRAQRALAVLRPLKVVIENYPEDRVEESRGDENRKTNRRASAGSRSRASSTSARRLHGSAGEKFFDCHRHRVPCATPTS